MGHIKRLFLLILLVFLVFSLLKNGFEYQRNMQFYKGYKEDLNAQVKKNLQLKTERLQKTSMGEVEKTIRNKLGLLRPGEVSVIIPLPTPSPTPIAQAPRAVYQQWLNTFFRID